MIGVREREREKEREKRDRKRVRDIEIGRKKKRKIWERRKRERREIGTYFKVSSFQYSPIRNTLSDGPSQTSDELDD
jgi:hypothetical protein